MLHRYQFLVDNNGTEYRDCDQASKSDRAVSLQVRGKLYGGEITLTRKIFKTLLSDSSPENLLPVPSKHKTNTFGGGCGPINGSILGLRRFQRLCAIPMMDGHVGRKTNGDRCAVVQLIIYSDGSRRTGPCDKASFRQASPWSAWRLVIDKHWAVSKSYANNKRWTSPCQKPSLACVRL